MLVFPVPVEPMMTILNISQSSSIRMIAYYQSIKQSHPIYLQSNSSLPSRLMPELLQPPFAPLLELDTFQQNKMNYPSAPTYSPPTQLKTSRLYQQLLANSFLHEHIYTTESIPSAAPIKYGLTNLTLTSPQLPSQELSPRSISPFKLGQSIAKTSHQATQSLNSHNYSIIEMENQSYSTINIYSMSHNHINADLSLSSNRPTEPLNLQTNPPEQEETNSKQLDLLLQGSYHRQEPTLQEISCLEPQEKTIRKYKSEDFRIAESQEGPQNEEEEEQQSPLPRLLADKYLRNDIKGKFSSSIASQKAEDNNFKTVLNQVYVVPYKINQEVHPYAFSLPVDTHERKSKAASLNLHRSKHSDIVEQDRKTSNPMFFSGYQMERHRPQAILTKHLSPRPSQPCNYSRPLPKSEPKDRHYHERTTRSNSIGAKNKPSFPRGQTQQKLDHSRVTRLFGQQHPEEAHIEVQAVESRQHSILYEQNQVNLCCGISCNANKINFMNREGARSSHLCEDMPKEESCQVNSMGSKRINSYKINPLTIIKNKEVERLNELHSKKGLKLVGFTPSFRKGPQ